MNYRKSVLSMSIIAALGFTGTAVAQDTAKHNQDAIAPYKAKVEKKADKKAESLLFQNLLALNDAAQPADSSSGNSNSDDAQQLGTIEVTGIRGSVLSSLQQEKSANSDISVVTAEDIGKLPAENVADTLQRLPGVNVGTASADEGGFDENDRVSLRGTNPSLTLTTIDGHNVGTGDWFVLSQVQTVGRGVSYSLLPAEVVRQVVVHKSSEAKLLEGGAAGSVDIITRKPLEFPKQFTGQVSIGAVYSDLPGKTKPQGSALFNFKNDANTVGVMIQGFYEERSLRRDGQEVVGRYVQIDPTSAIAAAHPDLAGAYYPSLLGSTSFLQTRKREGGEVDLELRPLDNLTLNLDGFYSKLEADNFNRNYMLWTTQFVPSGAGLQGYTAKNNVVTQATFAPQPGSSTFYGVYDMISRPGAYSETNFVTLNADWQLNQNLRLFGEVGTTNGKGESPTQDVVESNFAQGAGAHWQMSGENPISWGFLGGINPSSPAGSGATPGWIFGDQGINVTDDENWYKVDGTYYFDGSVLSSVDFGVRYADHTRKNPTDIGQGPNSGFFGLNFATMPYSQYPSDFGDGLSGQFPRDVWSFTQAQLAQINAQYANRDPVTRFNWQNIYGVNEKDSAAYAQANFTGTSWSGNVGVRLVSTDETVNYNLAQPDNFTIAGPITGSAFGDYYKSRYNHTYTKLLPSGNLKYNLRDDLVLRLAASQTLTRPNYSALAGYVSADDLTHTGSGGNPQLKPLVSTNEDVALEWYFAERGVLSADAFNMDLHDYVTFGEQPRQLKDQLATKNAGHDVFSTYQISEPVNSDGSVHGVELNYIQPIGEFFGVSANYTWAKGHADTDAGDQPLQGTSENTYNLQAYFENDVFSARVSYTYRSAFYAGVNRGENYFQDNFGTLSASIGYKINNWVSLSLDALNLNNPQLQYYTQSDAFGSLPIANYLNGRQYYLTATFKF